MTAATVTSSFAYVYWEDESRPPRAVIGYCSACKTKPGELVQLVSPRGFAHHADGDTTLCGRNATGDDWWWRS